MADGKQTPKITLYWLEESRAQRILWLLEELELPYEMKCFKRGKDMQADPNLKRIHPLGKSPVLTLETPQRETPLVLAESGVIIEYLLDYFGSSMIPPRYKDAGQDENRVPGCETEAWLRYRYFMHYTEGSLMTPMIVALVMSKIRDAPVPFFIKPITRRIADGTHQSFVKPNLERNFEFLNDQVKTAPGGGPFLCGDKLTGADIMLCFSIVAAAEHGVLDKAKYPELGRYMEKLQERPAYKRAAEKEKNQATDQSSGSKM